MSEISCPYCNYTTPYKERHCSNCGVDLALAAKLAEDSLSTKDYFETTFTPELLVPRLGEFLIKERLITEEELQQALDYQRTQAARGRAILIGQVLVEQGVIDRGTLKEQTRSPLL